MYENLNACTLLFHVFSYFLQFSRNRLAGDESPLGDSSCFWVMGVLETEPPGGTSLTARRRMLVYPVFWVLWRAWRWWIPARWHKPLLARFWCFLGSGRFLIGEKSRSNLYEWLSIVFHWKFVELEFNWDENCMKVTLGLMNWGFRKRH